MVPDWAKPYVGWVVGMDWPEGDEEGCFRLADACVTAAHRVVEGTGADQLHSAQKIGAAWDGEAHTAFAAHVTRVVGGRVAELVTRLVNAAVALNNVGVQIQYAKYMIEATVWLLILQLGYLLAAAVTSGGASLALIPARLQLARLTVAQIAERALVNMRLFAVIVGGMDAGVQSLQIAQGRRDDFDRWQLLMSTLAGGAMGAMMGGLSGGLSQLATPALQAGLSRAEMSLAEKLLAAATNSFYGQAAQYALTGGITTAGSMLVNGDFSWDLLAKGITSSALGADGQHLAAPITHGGGAPPPHPTPLLPGSDPHPGPGSPSGSGRDVSLGSESPSGSGRDASLSQADTPTPEAARPPSTTHGGPDPSSPAGQNGFPVGGRAQAAPEGHAVPNGSARPDGSQAPRAAQPPPAHARTDGGAAGGGRPAAGRTDSAPGPGGRPDGAAPLSRIDQLINRPAEQPSAPAPQRFPERSAHAEEGPQTWNDGGWEGSRDVPDTPRGGEPDTVAASVPDRAPVHPGEGTAASNRGPVRDVENVDLHPGSAATWPDVGPAPMRTAEGVRPLDAARDALAGGDVAGARSAADAARAAADEVRRSGTAPRDEVARAERDALQAERIAEVVAELDGIGGLRAENLAKIREFGLNIEIRTFDEQVRGQENFIPVTYDADTNTLTVQQHMAWRSPAEELADFVGGRFQPFEDMISQREFVAQDVSDWPGLPAWSEGAVRFRTQAEYDAWVDGAMVPQSERFTDAQKDSLDAYRREPTYREINDPLRGHGHHSPAAAEHTAHIDSAMHQSVIPEDVVVARHVSPAAFDRPIAQLEGTVQGDLAYVSTSTAKNPERYMHLALELESLVKLWLRVPEGTHAVHMTGLHPNTEMFGPTHELLLDRGVRYRVDKVVYEDGGWKVFGTVLGKEG
ncbi:ADP-ribosyltransferase [Streptosporangium roseum]|uniref:ADP-ribosyltransferase n=1 Tax=Streptosporangium roseum TaxID=2001 RepID=UPI00031F753D|nr:ADP-ribosyltransferase [Streptosporangium roseum]